MVRGHFYGWVRANICTLDRKSWDLDTFLHCFSTDRPRQAVPITEVRDAMEFFYCQFVSAVYRPIIGFSGGSIDLLAANACDQVL